MELTAMDPFLFHNSFSMMNFKSPRLGERAEAKATLLYIELFGNWHQQQNFFID